MPNALDLLLKRGRDEKEGAASDRRQKRLRPTPKAPEYSVCPVCNRRFPIPRLEAHVNLCLASQQHREQVLARPSNAGGKGCASATSDAASTSGNATAAGKTFPQDGGSVTASSNAGADALPAPGQERAQRPNAFAAMMQQQRELSRMAVFYLMRSEQGQFSIHWWLKAGGAGKKQPEQQLGPAHHAKASAQPPGQHLGTHFGAGQASQAGCTGEAAESAPDAAGTEAEARQARPAAQAPAQVPAAGPEAQLRQGMQAACESTAVWTSVTHMSASTVHGQHQPGGPVASAAAKMPVVLMTNTPSGLGGEVSWESQGPSERRFRGSRGVLKSALQKNVRLGRTDASVRVALHLLKEDTSEFLRRCSIICLEDAILHPQLPLLVWLMCAAAKGYRLGVALAECCLTLVAQMARVPVRDALALPQGDLAGQPAEEDSDEEAELERLLTGSASQTQRMQQDGGVSRRAHGTGEALQSVDAPAATTGGSVPVSSPAAATAAAAGSGSQGAACSSGNLQQQLTPQQAVLIRSMRIRAAFGGLKGDLRMLHGFAALWTRRLLGHAGPAPLLPASPGRAACQPETWQDYLSAVHPASVSVSVRNVDTVTAAHIPASAIDFHVSDIVEELLKKPKIQEAAAQASEAVAALGKHMDAAMCLRSAMWLFSSSKNWRSSMQFSDSNNSAAPKGVQGQQHQLLCRVWEASRLEALNFAEDFVRRRIW